MNQLHARWFSGFGPRVGWGALFVVGLVALVLLIFLAGCTAMAADDKPHLVIDDPTIWTNQLVPDHYMLMFIRITQTAASARPTTKSGRVVLIRVEDPTGIIEIPWIEGLTAVESLRAWIGGER